MSWNYRVIARDGRPEEGPSYGVHEVYYSDDGSILYWTKEPVEVMGETLAGVEDTLIAMLAATKRPVLIEANNTLFERDDQQDA
jgi:hypothetical protein